MISVLHDMSSVMSLLTRWTPQPQQSSTMLCNTRWCESGQDATDAVDRRMRGIVGDDLMSDSALIQHLIKTSSSADGVEQEYMKWF